VSGGPGNDIVRGAAGHDHLFSGVGADLFYARDRNRDIVRGGPGQDKARIDVIDRLFRVEVLF
jgi:Ca2+-binding RTX toxin-like protein